MHTNVILTNKRRTHAQSNYTNTKLKAWCRRLLRHPARKRSGSILHRRTPEPTRGEGVKRRTCSNVCYNNSKKISVGTRSTSVGQLDKGWKLNVTLLVNTSRLPLQLAAAFVFMTVLLADVTREKQV